MSHNVQRHKTYSVTYMFCNANAMCTCNFVTVYVLGHCTLCDVYVLKTLRFGALTSSAATFCDITSCDIYVKLLYVMQQHRNIYNSRIPATAGRQAKAGTADTGNRRINGTTRYNRNNSIMDSNSRSLQQ